MKTLEHVMLPLLLEAGRKARETVCRVLREWSVGERSASGGHAGSDVIYAIDVEVEQGLVALLSASAAALGGVVLIAEGIGEDEKTIWPAGWREADCVWRMLVDPIDGTRPIMMDKRSAWFLAGVAPNRGEATRLREVEAAVMMELPTTRAAVADDFAAVRGQGVVAERVHLERGTSAAWQPSPWPGPTLRGGFVQMFRFCPPGREALAALEEAWIAALFPDAQEGEILSFEDQYPSTGGQLVELLTGRDRFQADLRGVLYASPGYAGQRLGHVCHPYDLAGMLVAEEAGVILCDAAGAPLDGPLDTRTAMSWVGYPNAAIRAEAEAALLRLLRARGWIADQS